MTTKELKRFASLRKKVAKAIQKQLKENCLHKSYEGTWDIFVSFPNYFEDETAMAEPDFYQLSLHCYILGPSNNYEWAGKTFSEALDQCEKDINNWI